MKKRLDNSYFRIIDAARNRALEGLRVVEDFSRLHLEDGPLTQSAKSLRHELDHLLGTIGTERLVRCRDIARDPGTEISENGEYDRCEPIDLVRANASRVQQALRTIEELAKTFDSELARGVERIRYRSYALEKSMVNTLSSRSDLQSVFLYVLTDGRGNLAKLELLVEQLIQADVRLIQFRDKSLNDRQQIRAGQLLSHLTRDTGTRWIMNDRADLARLCNADGVHLGDEDVPIQLARKILGDDKIIGATAHSFEQATQAVLEGADYIGVGPSFPSATKSFESFATREFLASVVEEIRLPAFAIGGIHLDNVDQLLDMGFRRVAVSHTVIDAANVLQVVAGLQCKLRSRNSSGGGSPQI